MGRVGRVEVGLGGQRDGGARRKHALSRDSATVLKEIAGHTHIQLICKQREREREREREGYSTFMHILDLYSCTSGDPIMSLHWH